MGRYFPKLLTTFQQQLVGPATAPLNVSLLTPILLTAATVLTVGCSTSKIGLLQMVGTDMVRTLLWFSLSRLQLMVPHFYYQSRGLQTANSIHVPKLSDKALETYRTMATSTKP